MVLPKQQQEPLASMFITVIEESIFWSLADRGDPSVLPRCVFRSELQGVGQCQAGECCEQVRAMCGCLYVGGVIKRAAEVGAPRSEVAPTRPSGEKQLPLTFPKWKENCQNRGSPCQSHYSERGDRDRFTCNWGHFWHDIKWPDLLSTQHKVWYNLNNRQRGERMNRWAIWFWRLWSPPENNSSIMKISTLYFCSSFIQ